jgi:hypothetical protein
LADARLIRFAIIAEAFDAIAETLPFGSTMYVARTLVTASGSSGCPRPRLFFPSQLLHRYKPRNCWSFQHFQNRYKSNS